MDINSCGEKMKSYCMMLFLYSGFVFGNCKWCIENNSSVKNEINHLITLMPTELLKNIENQNIKVFILNPDRIQTKKYFTWGKIRVDSGKLSDLSKIEGSLGKTLCKDERKIAKMGTTIVLSSDAPYSTLIHEYLHLKQIELDNSWCEISKKLWDNPSPKKDWIKAVRDREWDVRLFLWSIKDQNNFNIEDKIVIAEGLIKEAIFRSQYDSSSLKYIKEKKVENYLQDQVKLYLRDNPTVKVKATPEINIPYRKN